MPPELMTALVDAAMAGVLDPGTYESRGPDSEGRDFGEPMNSWQRRAVQTSIEAALRAHFADAKSATQGVLEESELFILVNAYLGIGSDHLNLYDLYGAVAHILIHHRGSDA